VDLDAGGTKWNHIITEYKSNIMVVYNEMKPLLDSWAIKVVLNLIRVYPWAMYKDELTEIASILKIPYEQLVAMQLIYEASTACTCVAFQDEKTMTFLRTLDWDMESLGPLTIQVQFERKKQPIFIATTFAGCLGIFTGMRLSPKPEYGLALNFRRGGSLVGNAYRLLKSYWPTSYVIRDLLETTSDVKVVEQTLKTCLLAAPVYYTMVTPTDGKVILRGPSNEVISIKTMSTKIAESKDNSFVYQTNIDSLQDYKENILWSVERSEYMNKNFNKKMEKDIRLKNLIKYPIINEETLYYTLMQFPNGEYQTNIIKEVKKK